MPETASPAARMALPQPSEDMWRTRSPRRSPFREAGVSVGQHDAPASDELRSSAALRAASSLATGASMMRPAVPATVRALPPNAPPKAARVHTPAQDRDSELSVATLPPVGDAAGSLRP